MTLWQRSDIAWLGLAALALVGLAVSAHRVVVHAMVPVRAKVVEAPITVVRKVTPGPIQDALLGPLWPSLYFSLREPPPPPEPVGKPFSERWVSNFNTPQVWAKVCKRKSAKVWHGRKYRLVWASKCERKLRLEK